MLIFIKFEEVSISNCSHLTTVNMFIVCPCVVIPRAHDMVEHIINMCI